MRFIFLTLCLIIICNQSFSCSCNKVSVFKGLKKADLVFKGEVVDIKYTWTGDTIKNQIQLIKRPFDKFRVIEFTFRIIKLHKGKLDKRQVVIKTTGGDTDCGNNFDLGNKYLIYSYNTNRALDDYSREITPFLTTSLCTRTKLSRKTWPHESLIMFFAKIFRKDKLIDPEKNLKEFVGS